MTTTKPRQAAQRAAAAATAKVQAARTAEAICDAADDADRDEWVQELANGHPQAAAVLSAMDDEQLRRTQDMKDAQRAFIQLCEDVSYPVDQAGRVHDLQGLATHGADEEGANSTLLALFWTMALLGYRRSGTTFIKKRYYPAHLMGGVYKDVHTWVDMRAPDDTEQAVTDDAAPGDQALPPDVRGAAARRDGQEPRVTAEWHVPVKPIIKSGPRPKGW